MADEQHESGQIRRHLLGQLAGTEETGIRRRRAAVPEFDELCQAVEAELIDDFVQGRLARGEIRRFEERYLGTPEGARQVEMARTLLRSFRRPARCLGWGFGVAAVAALVAIVILATNLLLRKSPPAVLSFALAPGIVRSIEPAQIVKIPRSALLIKLRLPAEPGGDRAALRLVGSEEVILEQKILSRADHAEVLVPTAILPEGDYLLTLQRGGQPVASFYFRVMKP